MTLGEIASRVGCPLEGDATIEIEHVAPIDQAGPGDLTFLANPKYASALPATRASAVILGPGVEGAPCAVLRSPHPYLTFAKVVGVLSPDVRPAPGVDPVAFVASTAVLGEEVSVGPFAVVGAGAVVGARTVVHSHVVIGPSATIGPDCMLHAHVSIRERSVIGARVVLQDGVVIGSDGFGFAPREDGSHEKIPQTARVVIEDDVEIGANTTIDRPAIGETRIKAGAKIDNLVQIAHGVVVGRNCVLAAQVGIAGSTVLGDSVTLAGQVGVAGHISVGDRVRAAGQSGITRSLPPDAFVSGYPAIDNLEWRKASAAFRRLPELRKRISRLEQRLARVDKGSAD